MGVEDTLKKHTRTIEKSVVSNFPSHEVAIESTDQKLRLQMSLYKPSRYIQYVDEYIHNITITLSTDLGQTCELARGRTVRA
jgi:hypothetical protein